MITFLDLLIIVSMVLIAASLLSVVLMFLVKNKKIQRLCLYIVAALGIYIGYVGIRINWPYFFVQAVVAAMAAAVCIGALVVTIVKKDNAKLFMIARIASAVALVIGVANALLI